MSKRSTGVSRIATFPPLMNCQSADDVSLSPGRRNAIPMMATGSTAETPSRWARPFIALTFLARCHACSNTSPFGGIGDRLILASRAFGVIWLRSAGALRQVLRERCESRLLPDHGFIDTDPQLFLEKEGQLDRVHGVEPGIVKGLVDIRRHFNFV